MNSPWSHEELAAMRSTISKRIEATEAEYSNARPVPPLTEEESRELLYSLMDLAAERTLDRDELFLFGQLLNVYRMSIEARMLGKRGRYFVLSEADLERAAKRESRT